MRTRLAIAFTLFVSLVANAGDEFCYQGARAPAAYMPTAEDRAVFDRTLVAFVSKTVSTANEAAGLANTLLFQRSLKFMPQPRELTQGFAVGVYGRWENVKWNAEEVALWDAITMSALEQASPFRAPDPKLGEYAFYAAWETMMQRRMYVTYNCSP